MAELKSIVQQYTIGDYGKVNVKLKEVLESRGINRNRLKELTGVKYDVIDRYYKNENISLASDFRLRSQGPCRLGTGESGLVLG